MTDSAKVSSQWLWYFYCHNCLLPKAVFFHDKKVTINLSHVWLFVAFFSFILHLPLPHKSDLLVKKSSLFRCRKASSSKKQKIHIYFEFWSFSNFQSPPLVSIVESLQLEWNLEGRGSDNRQSDPHRCVDTGCSVCTHSHLEKRRKEEKVKDKDWQTVCDMIALQLYLKFCTKWFAFNVWFFRKCHNTNKNSRSFLKSKDINSRKRFDCRFKFWSLKLFIFLSLTKKRSHRVKNCTSNSNKIVSTFHQLTITTNGAFNETETATTYEGTRPIPANSIVGQTAVVKAKSALIRIEAGPIVIRFKTLKQI